MNPFPQDQLPSSIFKDTRSKFYDSQQRSEDVPKPFSIGLPKATSSAYRSNQAIGMAKYQS